MHRLLDAAFDLLRSRYKQSPITTAVLTYIIGSYQTGALSLASSEDLAVCTVLYYSAWIGHMVDAAGTSPTPTENGASLIAKLNRSTEAGSDRLKSRVEMNRAALQHSQQRMSEKGFFNESIDRFYTHRQKERNHHV